MKSVDPSSRSQKSRFISEISIDLKNRRDAQAVYSALKPEAIEPPNPRRTRVSIDLVGSRVVIVIKAIDLASLRAALNSYIYLIYASLKSIKIADTDEGADI